MANLSDLTRKDQVLAKLREALDAPLLNPGGWVDGPDLANEEVGGSEGLRRLRELKSDGYLIQERAHPDPSRAIHQYRLVRQTDMGGGITDRPHPQEVPNGGVPRNQPAPVSSAAPQPVAPPRPEASPTDWKRESATIKEYRREFWIREPAKQRVIGTVAEDMDRSRWFWALKIPEYKGLKGTKKDPGLGAHPEKVLGSGIVPKPGGQGLLEAMAACEAAFSKYKEQR